MLWFSPPLGPYQLAPTSPQQPTFLALPAAQTTNASGELQWETVAQDGRLAVFAAPRAISWIWADLLTRFPTATQLQGTGVIPILTKLVINLGNQPIRVDRPMRGAGGFYLAPSPDDSRRYLNFGSYLYGQRGTIVPPEGPHGEAEVGSVFAEHVFTNILAPAGQRGVKQLPPGFAGLSDAYSAVAPAQSGEVPSGATALASAAHDDALLRLTFDHSDSNQHTNSLVYVRWFIDAAVRCLAPSHSIARKLVRAVEIAYRKPTFAGDTLQATCTPFQLSSGELGVAGSIRKTDDDKPCCFVRVIFS